MAPPAGSPEATGARLLLLVPEFPPRSSGGGGLVYLRLAEEYTRAGARVLVLALDVTRAGLWARPQREHREGYDVVYLPVATRLVANGTSFTGALPPSLPGLWAMARAIRSRGFDAIHLHGVPMLVEDVGAGLARLGQSRYVLTVHGLVQSPERFGGPLARLYRAWLATERWIYRRARAVTAVSEATLAECRAIGLEAPTMAVVPVTPHPRPPATGELDGDAWLERHGLSPGAYVVCVGNFVPRKGQDILVEAVGAIARSSDPLPALRVAFAGSEFGTGYRAELERRARELGIADRLRFLGRVSEAEKLLLYRHGRAAVVPTRYEASPMVAFEALELGLPLIASDLPCLRELLRDGESALMFPPGDAVELANALRRLWTEPALAATLRHGALERAARFPTWPEIARQYLALLLSDGGPAPAGGSREPAR